MLNPILQMLNQKNPQNNIMMQAFGAMMRGESPQQFLQKLAQSDPRLQGLDLSNPEKAAEELYRQNGQNIDEAKASVKGKISQFLSNKQ